LCTTARPSAARAEKAFTLQILSPNLPTKPLVSMRQAAPPLLGLRGREAAADQSAFRSGRQISSVSLGQAAGSMPFSLVVASRLWMAAARRLTRSEPVNSQFFLPIDQARK